MAVRLEHRLEEQAQSLVTWDYKAALEGKQKELIHVVVVLDPWNAPEVYDTAYDCIYHYDYDGHSIHDFHGLDHACPHNYDDDNPLQDVGPHFDFWMNSDVVDDKCHYEIVNWIHSFECYP